MRSSAPITRASGHAVCARAASQGGVTISVIAPARGSTQTAGPSDLKPVSTVTGLGVSMKCAAVMHRHDEVEAARRHAGADRL